MLWNIAMLWNLAMPWNLAMLWNLALISINLPPLRGGVKKTNLDRRHYSAAFCVNRYIELH